MPPQYPHAALVQCIGDHLCVAAVVIQIGLDLSHAALGEHGGSGALHHIGHAVELGGLTAQPQLIQVHPLALQFLGHYGVAAAGAGKACDLGEGADLHGTLACTLDLEDAAGKLTLRDEALVGGIVQDNSIILAGVVHPCFQLCAGVGSAGGVVGAADIDDICLHALVRHAKEAIFLPGAAVNDLAFSIAVNAYISLIRLAVLEI